MCYTKQMTATDTTFGIVFWMNLHAISGRACRQRPAVLPQAGALANLPGNRGRNCRPFGAFLHGQGLRLWRCEPGGPARFPAGAADRGGRLAVFRRIRRRAGLCRRHDHPVRHSVEFAARRRKAHGKTSPCRTTKGCPSHSERFFFPAPLRGPRPFDNHRGASFRGQTVGKMHGIP